MKIINSKNINVKNVCKLILLSLVISIAILIKYHALVLIPVGFLFIFFLNYKSFINWTVKTFSLCVIPSLLYILIRYINKYKTGKASYFSFDEFTLSHLLDINWCLNTIIYFIRSIFHLQEKNPLFGVTRIFNLCNISPPYDNLILSLISISLMVLFIIIICKTWRTENLYQRKYIIFILSSFIGFISFYLMINSVSQTLFGRFYPFDYSRFNIFLLTLVFSSFTLWLNQFNFKNRFLHKSRFQFLIIPFIILILINSFIVAKNFDALFKEYNKDKIALRRVIKSVQETNIKYSDYLVICDNFEYHTMLNYDSFIPTFQIAVIYKLINEKICFTKKTIIFLILDSKFENLSNIDFNNKVFDNQYSLNDLKNRMNLIKVKGEFIVDSYIYWYPFDKSIHEIFEK